MLVRQSRESIMFKYSGTHALEVIPGVVSEEQVLAVGRKLDETRAVVAAVCLVLGRGVFV